MKYSSMIITLTNILNSLLKSQELPPELFTSRLVCLNKEADKRGSLDSIRPIAVMGTINKLLEFAVLRRIVSIVYDSDNRVRPEIICKDQIGFIMS